MRNLRWLTPLFVVAACGPTAVPVELGPRVEVSPRVKASWPGFALGLSPGRWYDRGPLHVSPDGEPMRAIYDPDAPSVPEPDAPTFIMGDVREGRLYEVELDAASLTRLAQALTERGWADGHSGEAPPLDERPTSPTGSTFYQAGWSGLSDNRLPRGIHELGVWAYQQVGQYRRGGTGTLIGTPDTGYYVITAAHVLFNADGSYPDADFIPRRDGCTKPGGAALAGCNTRPFGTWNAYTWMMSTYWLDNCRGRDTTTAACLANDIAIQEVGRPSGSADPGAMGFGYMTRSWFESTHYYPWNRGYPDFGFKGSPANLRPNTLYGDRTVCVMSNWRQNDSGFSRNTDMTCDVSSGHSGGPLFRDLNGDKVLGVIAGMYPECFDRSCGAGSIARMMTPTFYGWTLDFMGL
ncbi:MAG: hypothetical protein JNK82_12895 [Myxococcaceae bacterium]|nr:hypothetical protein [Myxococcaceae bacterium]